MAEMQDPSAEARRSPEPPDWFRLEPIFEATQEQVDTGLAHDALAPAWQTFLLGDGSPTRNSTLLFREPIDVDVIRMDMIGEDLDNAPACVDEVIGPRIRRQVWVRTRSGRRLYYAASWWSSRDVDQYLEDKRLPIWASLSQKHTELYRDHRGLVLGSNQKLADEFGYDGPFWARYYLFWHGGTPITLIYEVFSPIFETALGPTTPRRG